jgi:hypothetical protein
VGTWGTGKYQNDTAADVKDAKMSILILEPHNTRWHARVLGDPGIPR